MSGMTDQFEKPPYVYPHRKPTTRACDSDGDIATWDPDHDEWDSLHYELLVPGQIWYPLCYEAAVLWLGAPRGITEADLPQLSQAAVEALRDQVTRSDPPVNCEICDGLEEGQQCVACEHKLEHGATVRAKCEACDGSGLQTAADTGCPCTACGGSGDRIRPLDLFTDVWNNATGLFEVRSGVKCVVIDSSKSVPLAVKVGKVPTR